jgi:hypothetical protein
MLFWKSPTIGNAECVAESVCKVFIFLPDQKSIFFEKTFFEGSGQRTKFELVSSDQMTLLQWCMNMNKGFCSFPISQKINRLSLGFALPPSTIETLNCFCVLLLVLFF